MYPQLVQTIQYNTPRTAESFLARAGVEVNRRVLVDLSDVVTIYAYKARDSYPDKWREEMKRKKTRKKMAVKRRCSLCSYPTRVAAP